MVDISSTLFTLLWKAVHHEAGWIKTSENAYLIAE